MNLIDKIKLELDQITDEQLQVWCNSKECYDYLNR